MLDSLFITNFFCIKYWRVKADDPADHSLPYINESAEEEAPDDGVISKTSFARKLRHAWMTVTDPNKLVHEQKAEAKKSRMLRCTGCVKTILLGAVHREPNSEGKFADWRGIPGRKGFISTALLLIFSTVVLTPVVMKSVFSHSDIEDMLKPDFCKTEDHEEQNSILNQTLEDSETNLPLARDQIRSYGMLRESLQKDASLYGTADYECENRVDETADVNGDPLDISGNKDDWTKDRDVYPMSRYGTFFPGYCPAARELALDNAKNEKCEFETCKSHWIDEFLFSLVCITTPFPCPSHTVDDAQAVEQDYRRAQLERQHEIEDIKFEVYEPSDETNSNVGNVVDKVLFQIDVAGSLYVVYTALSLFFPSPLQLFRPSYGPMIKRFLFGANKMMFMVIVIAIWWGIEHFQSFYPALKDYLNIDLIANPCFADPDFLQNRASLISEKCEELVSLSNNFRISNVTIHHIEQEINAFQVECSCGFPFQNSIDITYSSELADVMEERVLYTGTFGWWNNETHKFELWSEYPLMGPELNTPFFGNKTICTNPTYTKEKYMSPPPEASANFFDIWIRTGLFAMIFVKISIANFGVSLLRVADPFSLCNGTYESPPERYGLDENSAYLMNLKKEKEGILFGVGTRGAVFWGSLTNLSLINICISQLLAPGDDSGQSSFATIAAFDLIMTISFAMVGMIVPGLAYYLTRHCKNPCCYRRRKKEAKHVGAGDGDGTGDDDGDDEDEEGSGIGVPTEALTPAKVKDRKKEAEQRGTGDGDADANDEDEDGIEISVPSEDLTPAKVKETKGFFERAVTIQQSILVAHRAHN